MRELACIVNTTSGNGAHVCFLHVFPLQTKNRHKYEDSGGLIREVLTSPTCPITESATPHNAGRIDMTYLGMLTILVGGGDDDDEQILCPVVAICYCIVLVV